MPQACVIVEVGIDFKSVQQQAAFKLRQTFGHFQFALAIAAESVVIVTYRDAERGFGIAFVEVEVLHHAVAVVGEHEQQMPVNDVFKVEVLADFVRESAVVGMNHKLHDVFQIAVHVFVFDVGVVLLEIIAGFLHPF